MEIVLQRLINVSGKQQKSKSGLFLGKAEPGESWGTPSGPTVEHSDSADAEGVRATAEDAIIDETTDDESRAGEPQTGAIERLGATERIVDEIMELPCAAAKLTSGVQDDLELVDAAERPSLISKSVPNSSGNSGIPYGEYGLISYENNNLNNLTRDHPKRSAQAVFTSHSRQPKLLKFAFGDFVRVKNNRRFEGRSPKWKSLYKEVAVVD